LARRLRRRHRNRIDDGLREWVRSMGDGAGHRQDA
jgi:hypothetical protein